MENSDDGGEVGGDEMGMHTAYKSFVRRSIIRSGLFTFDSLVTEAF